MKFQQYINEIACQLQFTRADIINEIFDSELIKISKTTSPYASYALDFTVDGEEYTFLANDNGNNHYGISFDKKGSFEFKPLQGKKYGGKALAGLFKSIKRLISDKKVDSFEFNTDNQILIRLYTKMVRYFEREIKPFKFIRYVDLKGGARAWRYER